jgi:UDP-GlcNAc:undecaprenyl-phosphate GlcNAc-1-phosphate transferase
VGVDLVGWSLVLLAASTAISWCLTVPMARLGLRLGLVDLPSSRRTREQPVATTGGIVVFLTTAASVCFALWFYFDVDPDLARRMLVLLIGGAAIVMLGVLDDKINLKPIAKLAGQVAVSAVMVFAGVVIGRIKFFLGPSIELGWVSYPLTIFWFVGFMNAFNLIDGLDGLAAGIAVVTATSLYVVALMTNNPLLFLMLAGVSGGAVGFLLHNFRLGNVYLGDAGSMVLGFLLAAGAIVGGNNDLASKSMIVAVACMIVPAFDVVTTVLRRGRSGKGVMTPDRSHVHHRLIKFGLNPKSAVIVLWGVTLFFAGQMLGLVAPYGVLYMLGSYGVLFGIAYMLREQRRKNLMTLQSDFRDEMLYLAGMKDDEEHEKETSLRQLIVAQIRREALYQEIIRGEAGDSGTTKRRTADGERDAGSEGNETRDPSKAPAAGGDETRDPSKALGSGESETRGD